MTREEKLKKLTDGLEQLSDEELDGIAGGTNFESAEDSKFLNNLLNGTEYYQCNSYSVNEIADVVPRFQLMMAWKSIGIDVKLARNYKNTYILDGKEISRDQALEYAKKTVGKI